MLVIHGIWTRDALCLWAEDSALPASPPAPAGGRPSRAAQPHPFAAGPDVLADALGVLGDSLGTPGGGLRDLAAKAAADELTLWLPSAGAGPSAAPELIRPEGPAGAAGGSRPGRGRRSALGCWRVPALAFGPAAALTILAGLDPADAPPGAVSHPDVIAGGSAVYWAAVARFAADLCARGKVLPGLSRDGDGWAAGWRTVLTGPDAPRAAELAGAMPPVCRAGEPGGEPPGPLLATALDALADAAARARLDAPARGGGVDPLDGPVPVDRSAPPDGAARRDGSGGPRRAGQDAAPPGWALLPPRRGRRPARVPVPERWAAALTGPDGEVEVATAEDEAEAAELAASLDAWRAAAQAPAGPVRTCFRLVEPALPAGDESPPTSRRSARPSPGAARPPKGRGTSSSHSSRPRTPA